MQVKRYIFKNYERALDVLAGSLWGVFCAVLAGGIGAWASVYSSDVRDCLSAVVANGRNPCEPTGGWWWVTIFAWIVFYTLRQLSISYQRRRETRALFGAINRCPNPSVLYQYPRIVANLRLLVRSTLGKYKSTKDPALLRNAISEGVSLICTMTSIFPHGMAHAMYRGNVMLYWDRLNSQKQFDDVKNSLVGFPLTTMSETALRGALQLSPDLSGLNSADPAKITSTMSKMPRTNLPVPEMTLSDAGKYNAFPGAPWAFAQGELSVFPKTSEIEEFCRKEMEHGETTRQAIVEYFTKGAGSDIRSFLSVRIGGSDDAIGVLNIDCDEQNLLGRDPSFFPSYRALLEPLVSMIEPLIRRYRDHIQ